MSKRKENSVFLKRNRRGQVEERCSKQTCCIPQDSIENLLNKLNTACLHQLGTYHILAIEDELLDMLSNGQSEKMENDVLNIIEKIYTFHKMERLNVPTNHIVVSKSYPIH